MRSPRAIRSREAAPSLACGFLAAFLAALLVHCGEPEQPAPPVEPDFVARFDAASRSLHIDPPAHPPDGGPLRLDPSAVDVDSAAGVVSFRVTVRTASGESRVGPEGVYVFDLSSPGLLPDRSIARCDAVDQAAPPAPRAGACLFDHRGTYGADGLLGPGETSAPAAWVFQGWRGESFAFRVRPVEAGLAAPGEVGGVVFVDHDADGRRDADELGLPDVVVLFFGGRLASATTDSSGAFAFQAGSAGEFSVWMLPPAGWRPTTPSEQRVTIQERPDSTLSGFGRADFGCTSGGSGTPSVRFLGVEIAGEPPCVPAMPCTVSFGVPFAVRFTATPAGSPIAGYQWQPTWPGGDPAPVLPECRDDRWLPAGRDTAADYEETLCFLIGTPCPRSSPSLEMPLDSLWSLQHGVVSAWYATRWLPVPSGRFLFRARVRDGEGHASSFADGAIGVVVNRDPDTRMERIPACDCPVPPPDCAPGDSVPIGWITGGRGIPWPASSWRRFCRGDTVPTGALVRFFVSGRDDPRDAPCDAASGRRPVGFAYRYEWSRGEESNRVMPWSTTYDATEHVHPNGTWRGGSIAWNACPFDFTFLAAAVDEHGRLDGTPDMLRFYASGAPVLDSLQVPAVLVLAPTVPWEGPRDSLGLRFSPDTMLVVGRHVPDRSRPPQTPLGFGWNDFELPIRAWGHDHPRDLRCPQRDSGIFAWRFTFDCTMPGCMDVVLPGEDLWIADRRWQNEPCSQQVFDELPMLRVPLDTLMTPGRVRAVLAGLPGPSFEFALEGRDTRRDADGCYEPFDLGPHGFRIWRNVEPLGRTTARHAATIVLRELREVRPLSSE